ncbi:MAG: hypothetical protein MUF75_11810, partial [Bacteroidia bacterium]|nr:hypothetical protein [Bacteroidia bacterium]
LTVEWLRTFGFEIIYYKLPQNTLIAKSSEYYLKGGVLILEDSTGLSTFLLSQTKNLKKTNKQLELSHETTRIPVKSMKYVHQLQNLYYSIEGEELTMRQ